MALAEDQKAKVRSLLGAADQFRYKNTRLESILSDGALSPEAETQIVEILAAVAKIEAAILQGGSSIFAGNIKRVDEISFFGSEVSGGIGFKNLKSAGRFFSARLSIITGVPIYGDYWGNEGWPGDFFMSATGGGPFRLG